MGQRVFGNSKADRKFIEGAQGTQGEPPAKHAIFKKSLIILVLRNECRICPENYIGPLYRERGSLYHIEKKLSTMS